MPSWRLAPLVALAVVTLTCGSVERSQPHPRRHHRSHRRQHVALVSATTDLAVASLSLPSVQVLPRTAAITGTAVRG